MLWCRYAERLRPMELRFGVSLLEAEVAPLEMTSWPVSRRISTLRPRSTNKQARVAV